MPGTPIMPQSTSLAQATQVLGATQHREHNSHCHKTVTAPIFRPGSAQTWVLFTHGCCFDKGGDACTAKWRGTNTDDKRCPGPAWGAAGPCAARGIWALGRCVTTRALKGCANSDRVGSSTLAVSTVPAEIVSTAVIAIHQLKLGAMPRSTQADPGRSNTCDEAGGFTSSWCVSVDSNIGPWTKHKTFRAMKGNAHRARAGDELSKMEQVCRSESAVLTHLPVEQGGRPVQILDPNRMRKLLGVWRGGGGGGSAGQSPGSQEGGQWVPQHTYLKMILMTR